MQFLPVISVSSNLYISWFQEHVKFKLFEESNLFSTILLALILYLDVIFSSLVFELDENCLFNAMLAPD